MDTPLKSTRRKLKKVMKKSRASLSVSTNNIYQKKLKSAINVSLNSTRTVRTLQSNNRSLATSLEKMRQDFRQVHDHYTLLLEENHELREKILELQRINLSEKYIDQEVDRRVEERMEQMKRKLVLLSDIATRFLDTLAELSDICVSSKSSMMEDLSSTESANQNYSLLPNLPLISSDVSLDNMSDIESTQSCHNAEIEMEYGSFEKNSAPKRNQMHEMTAIMEQSVLCPSADSCTSVSSTLDGVLGSFQTISCFDKKITTRLPVRIARHPNLTETQPSDQARNVVGELNKRTSAGSPKQVSRRQTFVVENAHADDCLITDVAAPQFLVSDCLSENGTLDINLQDQVRTPSTPARNGRLSEKGLPKGSASLKKSSAKQSHTLTPRSREQSPSKSSPLQQQLASPRGVKQSGKQRGTRSRTRHTSPKKSPVSHQHREKQATKKMGSLDQKSTSLAKKRNVASPSKAVSPKHSTKPDDKQQRNLFISNEFNLISVHKGRLEKPNKVKCNSIVQHESPSKETGEHTIFPVDDMEFTRMEESVIAPIITVRQISPKGDNQNSTGFESHLPVTYSRSRSKQSEPKQSEQDVGAVDEEKIPDAVTMRCTKPGQLMFAAARKESDGTRKNVPLVSKVRSKSKKKIAEMIENMVETQPETIFDFHDKTPVFVNNKKQKVKSVFNFSADESKLSPLTPLNKNRSRNRKSNSSSNDISSKNTSRSQSLETLQNDFKWKESVLTEVSVPLKDDSPPANSTYKTRSRSLGRRRVTENGNVEVKSRSPSRKRRAKSRAESPASVKTSSSSVTSSEVLSTDYSSSATKDEESKSENNIYLTSNDVEDGKPIVASHLTSEAPCKQEEDVEDLQVKKKEIAGNRTSKSRNTKAMSKRQTYDKEPEQNNESQTTEDVYVISASASDEHIVSVVQEEITEKLCMETAPSAESDRGDFYNDTGTKTTSESQSEVLDTEAIVLTKKKMKATSRKTRERSLPKSESDTHDSESESSVHTNFVNTRKVRTRGMKENKDYKDTEARNDEKSVESTIEDLAAIGDNAAQLTSVIGVPDAPKTNLEMSEETGQLLEQLKCLRTPAFSHSEDMQSGIASPTSGEKDMQKRNEHTLRTSRIVRGRPPGRSQSVPKRPAATHSPESEDAAGGKRRRAATKVNYAEMSLHKKLRRGDPFTSHYCTGDKISIFKSPKGKKKIVKKGVLGSLHNQSISEELVLPSEGGV